MFVSVVKLFLFVDLVGVALVVPLLPALALERMSQSLFGLSGSVYGLLQIFSAPLVLSLADSPSVDRRMLLALSSFLTAFSYLLLALSSSSVPLFFCSRVLAGCVRHSASLSKTLLEGELHLGDLQILSSVAFVAGPLVATRLPRRWACFLSVACLLAAAVVALILPNNRREEEDSDEKKKNEKPSETTSATTATTTTTTASSPSSTKASPSSSSLPRRLLMRSGLSSFGASLFSSALYASFEARTSGTLRSVAAASNVVALVISRKFGSIPTVVLALSMSVSMLVLAEAPLYILPIASGCGALLSRSLTGSLLSSRPLSQRGELVG